VDGNAQAYDSVYGRCIQSLDRGALNMLLLDALEERDVDLFLAIS
jgi:hypothetical protein